jgi:hypothetical protein
MLTVIGTRSFPPAPVGIGVPDFAAGSCMWIAVEAAYVGWFPFVQGNSRTCLPPGMVPLPGEGQLVELPDGTVYDCVVKVVGVAYPSPSPGPVPGGFCPPVYGVSTPAGYATPGGP